MKLFHVRNKESIEDNEKGLYLVDDEWDDFGYRTRFYLYYAHEEETNEDCPKKKMTISDIGSLKITYKGYRADSSMALMYYRNPAARLKYGETVIYEEFCSLGETLEYYENILQYFPLHSICTYNEILKKLRDVATSKSIYHVFMNEQSFEQSLLRESSSYKALSEAENVFKPIDYIKKRKSLKFSYRYYAPYLEQESDPIDMEFDFSENALPSRIQLLIGKNGTGKTQMLNALAESLSGITGIKSDNKSGFIGKRPAVDRIISMAYSAFDDGFKNRESSRESSTVSYVYCGIHSEDGLLSIEELNENFIMARNRIKEKKRRDKWEAIMRELMEDEFSGIIPEVFEKGMGSVIMSSGQRILMSTMTEAISNIESGSILLIDELELHLHPNAISNTVRMVYRLLELFDSYAIIATHSPLIVQEIPKKYVHVLFRVNNFLYSAHPTIECFGEDVTTITDDIFDVLSVESNYKSVLNKLSKKYAYKEILELFSGRLPLSARIYLSTCYSNPS